jgi:hypothetical protein
MEALDKAIPVRQAQFKLGIGPGPATTGQALTVTLQENSGDSPHRLRYCVLRPPGASPIVSAATTEVGVWVYGNGAAVVDLELEDANGAKWTTVQPRPDYSFGMQYRGRQAFDGWKYVALPFPGPGPQKGRWRREGAGGAKMTLPAKITGIVVSQFAKVMYVNALVPPDPPTWKIGDLVIE